MRTFLLKTALFFSVSLEMALPFAQATPPSSSRVVLEMLQSHGMNLESADYARTEENEGAQLLPIPTRIHEIIQPTIGFPALVQRDTLLPVSLQLDEKTRAVLNAGFKVKISLHAGTPPVPVRNVPEGLRELYRDARALHAHQPSTGFPLFTLQEHEETSRMKFSIPLTIEKQRLLPGHLVLVARVPANLPRHYNRALSLEVRITGPSGLVIHDVQDNSVGLTDSSDGRTFRFIHLADPQIGDEELQLTGPHKDRKHEDLFTQRTALRQAAKEFNFLKPDFAVISGDLVEGSNYELGVMDLVLDHMTGIDSVPLKESRYSDEYASIVQFLRLLNFPAFASPGNHDGYAAYTSMTNPKDPGVRYSGAWVGRERPTIEVPTPQELMYDGFHFFRKMIGPRYFSFNFGAVHFVILDTYDLQRYFRLAYGFVAANSGGWMSREQMDWLEADLQLATLAGKKIVLVGHHDPRALVPQPDGGREKRRSVRRTLLPFDRELMFQYENFKKDPLFFLQGWMSPVTTIPGTPYPEGQYDSASELLDLIARFPVTHFLAGHLHVDDDETEILGGKSVRFVHTTSISAAVHQTPGSKAHWGYRVFEVSPEGDLRDAFSDDPANSMELGNLRFQLGYDDHYMGKAAGLLSASRPMPSWLPFSEFLKLTDKNRGLPKLNGWSDPAITSWSLLSSKVSAIGTGLIDQEKWEREDAKALKNVLSDSFTIAARQLGTSTKPAQALFFNGNPEDVDGVLEFPLDDPKFSLSSEARLLRAMRPSSQVGFSLGFGGHFPLFAKRITEGGRTYFQLPLRLPPGELGVGPYIYSQKVAPTF
ncbi:MAG: hypothetical protein A2X94_00170 [Bdellovibrionales bacterium GWB1_55_8]|nr:MAG: hypothetical protein A2X94_00170 [Bdellovibrionales bacterium GWB1_55_8]